MYFPKGFNLEQAIELGELVDQAYAQFEAFKKGEDWNLPGNYLLKKQLHYRRPRNSAFNIGGLFEADLNGIRPTGEKDSSQVPIGFIAQRKDRVFIIFRGTITDQEWIQNIRIRLVPYLIPNFGRVHDGFLQIYNLYRTEIQETLDGMGPARQLFFAGHSLGGALATLALPDIGSMRDPKSVTLYTYGSPRIGDKAFVTAFNREYGDVSFRIINTSDLVELIPPPAPIIGSVGGYFSHVETPINFTVQEEDLVKNHHIRTYLSALEDSRPKKGILNQLKSWFARYAPRPGLRTPAER